MSSENCDSGKREWAFVSSGGGCSVPFASGVLDVLVNEKGLSWPKVIVGSSASAPLALAKGPEDLATIIDIWRKKMTNPAILRDGMIDVQRVMRFVREGISETFFDHRAGSYFCGTEVTPNGLVSRMLDAQDCESHEDVFNMVQGSMTLGNPEDAVSVMGRQILDGDLSFRDTSRVAFVRDELGINSSDIVAVNCVHPENAGDFLSVLSNLDLPTARSAMKNIRVACDESPPEILIRPERALLAGLFNNSPEAIEEAYEEGRRVARQSGALGELTARLMS